VSVSRISWFRPVTCGRQAMTCCVTRRMHVRRAAAIPHNGLGCCHMHAGRLHVCCRRVLCAACMCPLPACALCIQCVLRAACMWGTEPLTVLHCGMGAAQPGASFLPEQKQSGPCSRTSAQSPGSREVQVLPHFTDGLYACESDCWRHPDVCHACCARAGWHMSLALAR
jgi:hypothetical protein